MYMEVTFVGFPTCYIKDLAITGSHLSNTGFMETYSQSVDVKSLDQNLKLIELPHCPTGKVFVNGFEAVMGRPGVFRQFNRAQKVLTYIEFDVNSPKVADINIECLNDKASYWPIFRLEKVVVKSSESSIINLNAPRQFEEHATPLFSNLQRPDANSSVMNKEFNAIIEHAITKLPPEYTMVFTMGELNRLTTEETADAKQINTRM